MREGYLTDPFTLDRGARRPLAVARALRTAAHRHPRRRRPRPPDRLRQRRQPAHRARLDAPSRADAAARARRVALADRAPAAGREPLPRGGGRGARDAGWPRWGSRAARRAVVVGRRRPSIWTWPLDWRVLGFTTAVSAAAALLFGVAPALSVSRLTPNEVLKEHGRDGGLDRRAGLRHASVVLQVALSLALVVGAGLFTRTFVALQTARSRVQPAWRAPGHGERRAESGARRRAARAPHAPRGGRPQRAGRLGGGAVVSRRPSRAPDATPGSPCRPTRRSRGESRCRG